MKAIQTRYAGCHFRSRLEARWAVALDHLGVKWEYEPQGFELPSGPYLPDFWLPELKTWIEVKGQAPTKKEVEKACDLGFESKYPVHLLAGDIPRQAEVSPNGGAVAIPSEQATVSLEWIKGNLPSPTPYENSSNLGPPKNQGVQPILDVDIECLLIGSEVFEQAPRSAWGVEPGVLFWTHRTTESLKGFNAALAAARSARFEHGHSGVS